MSHLLFSKDRTDTYGRDCREHIAFQKLLGMVPGLETKLMEGSDKNMLHIADLVYFSLSLTSPHSQSFQIQKGVSSSRSDDTKSLKGAVVEWITPRGQPLNPPLARNVKYDRGFHHDITGALLCPADLQWSDAE
jgi:hypothetical protein